MRRANRRGENGFVQRSVLIVDDHAAFRSSARLMLEADGYTIVGEAADGASALTETERLRPSVVLLDIQLPDVDGFRVAERLATRPDAPIIVLISSREAIAWGARLAISPARVFIAKGDLTGSSLTDLLG